LFVLLTFVALTRGFVSRFVVFVGMLVSVSLVA